MGKRSKSKGKEVKTWPPVSFCLQKCPKCFPTWICTLPFYMFHQTIHQIMPHHDSGCKYTNNLAYSYYIFQNYSCKEYDCLRQTFYSEFTLQLNTLSKTLPILKKETHKEDNKTQFLNICKSIITTSRTIDFPNCPT